MAEWAAAIVVGYLLGSIPVAVLVGRRYGVDLRRVGSGNPGYWNAQAQLGRRQAAPVFIGDTLKGVAAGAVGLALAGDSWGVAYAAVAAAMVGHAWPVFAGFVGGRSVLTFVGGMCVLSPVAAAVAVAACVVTTLVSGRFALGARVGVFGFPLAQLLVDPVTRVAATGALMSIIGLRFLPERKAAGRADPATDAPDAAPPG